MTDQPPHVAEPALLPLLVAGEWVADGVPLEVRSPYDGALVGRVAAATTDVLHRAVTSAAAAADEDFAPAERASVLERAANAVAGARDELPRLIALRPESR